MSLLLKNIVFYGGDYVSNAIMSVVINQPGSVYLI